MPGPSRTLRGPLIFVITTMGLTWVSAAICEAFGWVEAGPPALLHASLIYLAIAGWQPLVAVAVAKRLRTDGRAFDDGQRPITASISLRSVGVAVFVLGVTVLVDLLLSHGAEGPRSLPVLESSWVGFVRSIMTFGVVLAVLWGQAIVEELGWRGYLLPRLMRTLGAWLGLFVHGALWGLCYAPVFIHVGGGSNAIARSLGFIVTCTLLGVILGWLRLASRSIYSSAASNATLTICAGLPLALLGVSSRLTAAFEPPGWIALSAVIAFLALRRSSRALVVVPWNRLPEHMN